MAAFCLPEEYVNGFKAALKSGALDPVKLAEMTSAGRRSAFETVVGRENAEAVNALFESKLLLKNQQAGLIAWAKKVGGIKDEVRKDFVSRIEKLDRILTPSDQDAFLSDLAAQKLGVTVTAEEANKIAALAKDAAEERAKLTDNFSGVSDEYLNKSEDLRHYVESLKPTTAINSIGKNLAIIARNDLLLNPSTPIKASMGQIVNSAMDIVSRRIANWSLVGAARDIASAAKDQAWRTFRETGLNTASMESMKDTGRLGEKNRFDVPDGMLSSNPVVHTIEAVVRNAAKISNKVAIDWEHNITFTKFYQSAFYDMLNIAATNIAKSEGLVGDALVQRAGEIVKDAARIEPETDIGATIRAEGQKQAARVTSTNETLVSRLALGVKDVLNKAVNGLGDILMPIAKIPANIIWNGIENAGAGIPMGAWNIFQGRMKIQSTIPAIRNEGMAQFANGIQQIGRTVGTVAAAAYFSSLLTKQDFKTDAYGGHFVKIGGLWINTEYISAISPALAGMMSVKEHGTEGQGVLDTAGQYVAGAGQSLKSAPGVDELRALVTSITNSNWSQGIKKYAENFFTSRGEPAFIQNLQKDRPIDRLFFGAHGLETESQVAQDTADVKTAKVETKLGEAKFGMDVWGQPAGSLPHDDPVAQELRKIQYAPSFPMPEMPVRGVAKGVPLADDQYKDFIQTAGRFSKIHIGTLLAIPGWQSFPVAWRAQEIRSVIEHDRKAAMAKIQMESMNGPHDLMRQGIQAAVAARTKAAASPSP